MAEILIFYIGAMTIVEIAGPAVGLEVRWKGLMLRTKSKRPLWIGWYPGL